MRHARVDEKPAQPSHSRCDYRIMGENERGKILPTRSCQRRAGKGGDALASGICTRSQLDRELDKRHLRRSSFMAGFFKHVLHGRRIAFV